jgi:death-on-curing protein
MIWLDAEVVIQLHSRIIQRSGGLDGLRDRAALEAALAAPAKRIC